MYYKKSFGKGKSSEVLNLSGDLELLDLVQQDLGLTGGEVGAHGLQDAVEGLGDGGLEVSGVHLAGLVVGLQLGVGVVHHGALGCTGRGKRRGRVSGPVKSVGLMVKGDKIAYISEKTKIVVNKK